MKTRFLTLVGLAAGLLVGVTATVQAQFTDVPTLVLANSDYGNGVAWGDFDGDGDLDLAAANNESGETGCGLFRNDGGGVFADVTSPAMISAYANSVAWVDYDNDGHLDLFSANGFSSTLFHNEGNGVFTIVMTGSFGSLLRTWTGTWADFNSDGWVDLFSASSLGLGPNRLLRNHEGAAFTDVENPLLNDQLDTQTGVWADYDNDGDLDLYLVHNYGADSLLRNDRGAFVNVTAEALSVDNEVNTGAAWGDYDNDGDLDLLLSHWSGPNRLLRNESGCLFVDVTSGSLAAEDSTYGVAWGDYDNDGMLDIFLAKANGQNQLLRNEGGVFVDVTPAVFSIGSVGTGCAWGDYDNDGDLDLFLSVFPGSKHLYRNDLSNGNHWLHLDLQGRLSNRSAIGARVILIAGGRTQIREVSGGSGYFSQDSLTVEFGLGTNTVIDSVLIRWPSGTLQTLTGIGVDQRLHVIESGPEDQPPVITSQPVGPSVYVGETIRISLIAWGTWPLTYQWRKDGADLAGATNALLVLTNVTLADAGDYTVTVSNTYGSATSIPAVVEVSLKPPEITVQPTDQTVCSGAPVNLSVSAAGSPPLTYQWRHNELDLADGDRIAGAHAATLTLSAAGVEDIGFYSVSVSNAAGRVTSQSAVLEVVLSPPRITEQPRTQAAALGSTVSLEVGATGSLPFTYQWQCNGQDLGDGPRIAGSRAGRLQISGLSLGDLGSYTVTVANAFGSVRSRAAELTTSSAVLDISVEAGLLAVSWNAPGRGMRLQWTPSLANPNWQDIPESERTSRMTFAMTEASAYFRLFGTLPQDLIAYYPLDGDANDHSGYGNHGTLVNVAPAADRFGHSGGAVSFNGMDGYAELPQSEQLSWLEETNEITVSAWTYLATSSHWESASYICKYNIGDDWGWEILANPDEIWFGFRVPEDSYRHCFDSQQHLQWMHVVVTGSRTRQQVCFYLNGDLITSGAVNDFHLKTTIGPMYLGYSPMGPDEFRASLMDDVRIYSRAFSDSEVRTLYEYESTSH